LATDSSSDRDPVERLAEEYLERRRRGEPIAIDDYADRHPEWAERIREVFPALEMMERLKPGSGERTGSFNGEERNAEGPGLERLGDYRILREVGRGGMGVVYEAVQESLGRHVALKVLPMHGRIDPVQMERFRLEARSAAKLHHTHIVPVHGVGQHGGVHYYAMQFIQGCGLDAVIDDLRRLRLGAASDQAQALGRAATAAEDLTRSRAAAEILLSGGYEVTQTEGPVSEGSAESRSLDSSVERSGLSARSEPRYYRSVARIGVQVAEALAHAHGQGVLHRDIKPSNLLVAADGEVWVTDFGLAKVEGGDGLTRTGDVVGTLRYMAPERFDGWSDPRSDVYGLGMTLYELLTLRAAFEGGTRARLIERVIQEVPSSPRKYDATIPRDLETIVLKAIAKEPAERYATAKALAEDLGNFLAGNPILARRTGTWERLRKWSRRHPAAAALVGMSGVAALTLAGLGVALFIHSQLRSAYAEVEHQRGVAEQQRGIAERALANERTFLYQNRIMFAERELNDNSPHRAEELLDECPPDRRDWEWNYLKRQCHTDLMTIPHSQGFVRSVAVSPDGRLIATAGTLDGAVKLWHADTGQKFKTLSGHLEKEPVMCTFSPDGRRIASVGCAMNRTNQLLIREVDTDKEILRLPVRTSGGASLAFSPDGRKVAVASGIPGVAAEGWVKVYDAETGKEDHTYSSEDNPALFPSFSPDGKSLLALLGPWDPDDLQRKPKEIRVWDLQTKTFRKISNESTRLLVSARYTPDGRMIATCGYDSTLRLWDAEDGHERAVFRGHRACTNFAAFSSDGRRVATTSDDGSARIWDLQTGETLITLRGHEGAFDAVAFSPDDRRLVTSGADGTVRVWDATTSPEARTIIAASTEVRALAFSPDGHRLLTGDADGVLKLWEVPSGQLLTTWSGHTKPVWDVAFSPDGSLVASAAGNLKNSDQLGEVHVRDAATERVLCRLPAHQAIARCVRFSSDSRRLISAGGETHVAGQEIIFWDMATGTSQRRIPNLGGGPLALALSPDGRHITAGILYAIQTWDTETGESFTPLERPSEREIRSLAYSPDGRTLFTTNLDGSVGIWDLTTRRLPETLLADKFGTYNLALNPRGTRMVTVGSDYTVKLWDTVTHQHLITLYGHPKGSFGLFGVAFSPDGHWIASSDSLGVVKLWDGSPWKEGGR
jgi:WD40 repeat protein/serine/threonine protein kinase